MDGKGGRGGGALCINRLFNPYFSLFYDTANAVARDTACLLNTIARSQVLGEYEEFMEGVDRVAKFTNFDNNFVVSVFEVTIRTLGCVSLFLLATS